MRVLITGGTGFLGRHCAWRLRKDHEVSVMGRNDRIGNVLEQNGIRYVKSELTDAERVRDACKGQDYIIHSGGLASPWGSTRLL